MFIAHERSKMLSASWHAPRVQLAERVILQAFIYKHLAPNGAKRLLLPCAEALPALARNQK